MIDRLVVTGVPFRFHENGMVAEPADSAVPGTKTGVDVPADVPEIHVPPGGSLIVTPVLGTMIDCAPVVRVTTAGGVEEVEPEPVVVDFVVK